MKAYERHIVAMVSLREAKSRLERIVRNVEDSGLEPSMELMAACVRDVTNAMTHAKRSVERVTRPVACDSPGCRDEASYSVCLSHAVDVPHRSER